MLFKQICATALMSAMLMSSAQAAMYAWNTQGDGRVYSWGSPPDSAAPQVRSWNSPDGNYATWSYSTPGYSMWSYPTAAENVPQFYNWSAPATYPQGYYFYYPMYPGGGMYFYQAPLSFQ